VRRGDPESFELSWFLGTLDCHANLRFARNDERFFGGGHKKSPHVGAFLEEISRQALSALAR